MSVYGLTVFLARRPQTPSQRKVRRLYVQVDFQTGGTPLPRLRQTVVNTGNGLRCGG